MRFKHNKKRNTAFLFEILVKELTKSVVNKDLQKKQQVVEIIKNYFNENEILGKELQLYKSIMESGPTTPRVAEKILFEVRVQHKKLDKKELFNKQSSLINTINKSFSKDVYSNFVPEYKIFATICQVMNEDIAPQDRVLLEEGVINMMTKYSKKEDSKPVPIDMLTYKTFINKFNDKYGDLNENQKTLLNKYIASFADNGLEFKIFLNEEVYRLKETIGSALVKEDIKKDEAVVQKLQKILDLISDFGKEKVDSVMLERILKIQTLTKEVL